MFERVRGAPPRAIGPIPHFSERSAASRGNAYRDSRLLESTRPHFDLERESMRTSILTLAVLGAWAAPTFAQLAPSIFPLPASGIYRLDDGSSYAEGCQPPCLCPIALYDDVAGTMRVTPQVFSQFGQSFTISQVNWRLTKGDQQIHVTGSGFYSTTNSFLASPTQQLVLDLQFDGGEVQTYDSGVVLSAATPGVIDLSIAVNDFFCFDQVFNVQASSVSIAEYTTYQLGRSGYQEGCFPPCLCPLLLSQRLFGSFGLVPLNTTTGGTPDYAVVDVSWTIASLGGIAAQSVEGSGFFDRVLSQGGFLHSMDLSLSIDGDPLQQFDTGLYKPILEFPSIDATLSMNDQFCFDQVFTLRARPLPIFLPAGG